MISTKHLQILTAVMRQGSVTGAAEELSISQPTASKAIKRLEDIAGVRLFERLEGRLRPTAEALVLAGEAERLNDEHVAFERLLSNIRHQNEGMLRVSMAAAFAASIMPRAIVNMSRAYPDVQVHAKVDTQTQIVDDSAWGRIDLGIVHFTQAEPLTTSIPLCSGRIVCIMPPDHELARKTVLNFDDLEGWPLLAYHPYLPFARSIQKNFADCNVSPVVRVEANHTSMIRDMVRLGGGIALVDEFTLWFESHGDVVARPIEPAIEISMGVVYARNRPLSRMAQNLVDCLKDVLEEPKGL